MDNTNIEHSSESMSEDLQAMRLMIEKRTLVIFRKISTMIRNKILLMRILIL